VVDVDDLHDWVLFVDLVDHPVGADSGGVEPGQASAEWSADPVGLSTSGPNTKSSTAIATLLGSRSIVSAGCLGAIPDVAPAAMAT
jgi:hypothetical protein